MRRKVVVIEWDDAFIDTDDFTAQEAQETTACKRRTVGFLVNRNKHGYTLATDEYAKRSDGYASRMFIPHGIVTQVTTLTPDK